MNDTLKKILIERIIQSIPANIKPVTYLSDLLGLSRNSVYRRLNGQIDFSLNEIALMADEFALSLDSLLCEYNPELALIGYQANRFTSPKVSMKEMLQLRCKVLLELSKAETAYTFTATNRLLGVFTLKFPNLWKFTYYKWIHQFEKVPLTYYFKDLNLPHEILDLLEKARNDEKGIRQLIIIDNNILVNLITEIKYYVNSGLISQHELVLLKNAIGDLLEYLRAILQTGTDEANNTFEIYLSPINIPNNFSYVNFDNEEYIYYFIHSDGCIHTKDTSICLLQKEWLKYLKSISTLITLSESTLREKFIHSQYEYLDRL